MQGNALYYFHEAARLGSMRLASDKIGVAVSSISRQIAQLERDMGVALIERGRRSIRMTEAGRLAYEYYQGCVANEEAFMNRLHEHRQMKAGKVSIAVGEGFLGGFFSKVLEEFQGQHPGIAASVSVQSTTEIVRAVLDDNAHFGLIFNDCAEPKIRVRAVAAQPLMVVCAPDHSSPPPFPLSSLYVMREAARAGRMVTVLPRIAVTSELEEGTLVVRPLSEANLEDTTISLIHRLGRQLDGAPARLLAAFETRIKGWNETETGRD